MEFNYQAKNQEGLLIEGKIEAPNEDQAVRALHQKDVVILSLVSSTKPIFSKDILKIFSQPNKKDVVAFTRQLATLVDADVPLVDGLRTLSDQSEKEAFRKVVSTIANSIEGGASLSLALSEHTHVFSPFYISLVRSGEAAGKLHTTLLYLAEYLETSAALTAKIRSALSYPTFVFVAIILVSGIMFTYVLPQMLAIFKESGATDLPFTTKILIWVTNFINNFFILILMAMIGLIIGTYYYIKSEDGRLKWHTLKLELPQFGKIIRNFYIARLGETLSTLIKSGVPILDGLAITADVVNNDVFKKILLEAKTNVQGGGSISEVFGKYKEFPGIVSSMLAIGERTGRTDYMLDNVTKFFKTETENSVQNLTQLIEPIMILFLGLAVGVLVSAVLLPIYNLVGVS